MRLSRRDFARQAFLVSEAFMLGCARHIAPSPPLPAPIYPDLPDPASSGIEHVVVVTMENRSFDHLFGWIPNAEGKQSGLAYTDKAGTSHPTYSLSPDYTGCPHPDPDHSYAGSRVAHNNGRMDGF